MKLKYEKKNQRKKELSNELVPGPSDQVTEGQTNTSVSILASVKWDSITKHYSEIKKPLLTKMGQQIN